MQVLGLWGMGGIGKTTLAAKLFNSLLPGFGDAACFLHSVRLEACHAGGLVRLQQKLLKSLTGIPTVVGNAGEGLTPIWLHELSEKQYCVAAFFMLVCLHVMIEIALILLPPDSKAYFPAAGCGKLTQHLQHRKVLLVIDDVDDHDQLRSLLPPCELHPQSLVIVTSRNKDVLSMRCCIVSEVQLLPKGCDEQLFKAWAFAAGSPAWDTSVLVPEILACCGGLPLTLKVSIAHALRKMRSKTYCAHMDAKLKDRGRTKQV